MENVNLITIFLTGLLTGGLSCMAVQGGLLAATIAQHEEARLKNNLQKTGHALPIFSFLFTKLIAYTILGALLGWMGSFFTLSLHMQVAMQLAVAVFMIGTALNILNVHPIFRYFVIQPPKFIARRIRKEAKSGDVFAPALLGALTVFIPCGTTQAMMALAVATGNPIAGALVLFAFTFGTSPIFFLLGYFTTKLGGAMQEQFMRIAAYAILILAVFNVNNAIALTGSTVTLGTLWKDAYCTFSFCSEGVLAQTDTSAVNEATIMINDHGYSPNTFAVKAGADVTLHLQNAGAYGCAQAFTIPSLNVQKIVTAGHEDTITFTAPHEKGEIAFMCSMGMYQGKIQVI